MCHKSAVRLLVGHVCETVAKQCVVSLLPYMHNKCVVCKKNPNPKLKLYLFNHLAWAVTLDPSFCF